MVQALATGGYVVAWTSTVNGQGDVFFQRFDATGAAVGGPVSAGGTTATTETLNDIAVTADGRITLAWTSGNNVVTRSFDSATGTATSGEVVTAAVGTSPTAQLVATGSNQYKVLIGSNAGVLAVEQATFSTAGAVVAAKSAVVLSNTVPTGVSIVEAVTGAAGEQILLTNTGFLISTNGQVITSALNPASDLVKLADGTYVLAQGTSGSSEEAKLTAVSGIGALNPGFSITGEQFTPGIQVLSGTGMATFDKTAVNLGDGRIMVFHVADTGLTFNVNTDGDGLYSAVYNTQTGFFEPGQNTQIRNFGQINSSSPPELTGMLVDADRLADGRVVLTFSQKNGLFGLDVYSAIFDPRISGATITGTAAADLFIGTNFPALPDTVTYGGLSGTNIKVDLLNASLNSGAAAGDSFVNIENITGTLLGDEIYGTLGANVFDGGSGADKLFGRDGNDTLNGGADDDQIRGGSGDDLTNGGTGFDTMTGNGGNDTMDGGDNDDRMLGGIGNDVMFGGAGNDKMAGNAGDDQIDGGTGADTITGGAGEDTIVGGDGNDIIRAGGDSDTIDAGLGNDFIFGGNGTNAIDGGGNIDTVSYLGVSSPTSIGVFIELDTSALDPVTTALPTLDDDDMIANVENAIGSSGDDKVYGNAVGNALSGSSGDDFIFGRGGADQLSGGTGQDSFVYTAVQVENDKIVDFSAGNDKIMIQSSAFSGINASNILASLTINAGGAPAASPAPQFIFDNAGAGAGQLTFDADGNGAGAEVLLATITFTSPGGLGAFGAGDFVFI